MKKNENLLIYYLSFLTKRTRDVNTAKRTIKSANLRSDFIRPVAEHPDRIVCFPLSFSFLPFLNF